MTTTTVSPSISVQQMKEIARNMRIDIIKMIGAAGSGHPGGSLSEVELMVALYFKVMRHDPKRPKWDGRDRFILSKGHGCATLYSVLAETGYIDHALLPTFRKLGSPLQGHPDKRFLPILEASTGSLGQGLSIGIGIALAGKLNQADFHTFVMTGDGEIQESQNWEAAMSSAIETCSPGRKPARSIASTRISRACSLLSSVGPQPPSSATPVSR